MRHVLLRFGRADGQASVEHAGLVLLVALLLVGLAVFDVPPVPAQAIARAICSAVGEGCRAGATAPAPPGTGPRSELELVDRYLDASLDEFLAYRASPDRDPRLDWSTNLCSAPLVGSSGASFDFTEACLRHDFGYRNYRRLGLFEDRKSLVDDRFLADMRAHCATRAPGERDRCRAWAQAFYLAVRHLGHLRQAPASHIGLGPISLDPAHRTRPLTLREAAPSRGSRGAATPPLAPVPPRSVSDRLRRTGPTEIGPGL